MVWCLAFDLERSGVQPQHTTIAIGASVVNSNREQLDHYLAVNYRVGKTVFEERCMREFWSKHTNILEQLAYTGPLTPEAQECAMITEFQHFRRRWEAKARETGETLVLVSDNNVFDGAYINQLIAKHTVDLPLPFSASYPQTYQPFWETHSLLKGCLLCLNEQDQDWGLTERVQCLVRQDNTAAETITHDHLPHHDAYTIACDYLNLRTLGAMNLKI